LSNSYKAIKEYYKSTADPVVLIAGSRVFCLEESNPDGDWPNWILCKTDDIEGWVPAQIIDREGEAGSILEDYSAAEFDIVPGEIFIG
jgi:hypothetical protein